MGSAAQALILVTAAVLLAGCGSSKSVSERTESDYIAEAKRFEADFKPSQFLPEPPPINETPTPRPILTEEQPAPASEPPEIVQGFRVQIYSSTSIDDADSVKLDVEDLFPEEWVYVVYDPPTYKVRCGNFLTRFEADRFATRLRGQGFKDAWVVPERVYKSPSPRQIEDLTPQD